MTRQPLMSEIFQLCENADYAYVILQLIGNYVTG